MVAVALHYGSRIDPAGDGFKIGRLRLCAGDMLNGTITAAPVMRGAIQEWWLIEFQQSRIW